MGNPKPANLYGEAIDLGGRLTQQDAILSLPNLFTLSQRVYHVFGIFDGHGMNT
jgi:hypothetical protein